MKTCTNCKTTLSDTEFVRNSQSTDGLHYWCKACTKSYRRKYYQENQQREKEKVRMYQESHKDEILIQRKRYTEKNRERIRAKNAEYRRTRRRRTDKTRQTQRVWVDKNRDRVRATQRKWNAENRTKINMKKRELDQQRRRQDPIYRLTRNLRSRLWHALSSATYKTDRTMNLVGCSITELKRHLESKFQTGMRWENYGLWHVDHIKPCVSFDLTIEKNQRECFHYTNLQPLWAADNLSKGGRL